MTADKNCKVATGDVEDQLALVSVVLVDRDLVLAEAGKDRANVADGGVGNLVDLVVGELDALLEVLTNGSELVSGSLSLDNGELFSATASPASSRISSSTISTS